MSPLSYRSHALMSRKPRRNISLAGSTQHSFMSQASFAFFVTLLSLVQADNLGRLTVCIVEAYNLENLDENEPFGGSASDP